MKKFRAIAGKRPFISLEEQARRHQRQQFEKRLRISEEGRFQEVEFRDLDKTTRLKGCHQSCQM